jgi:hypothetical protein
LKPQNYAHLRNVLLQLVSGLLLHQLQYMLKEEAVLLIEPIILGKVAQL